RGRVLLVDDEPIVRELVRSLLGRLDLDVTEAGDGQEALMLFGARTFDAVLLDGEMPGMDGLETVRAIRAAGGRGASLPVIAMTAHSSPEDRARYLAAGMSEHVGKPVDERELARVLGRFVRVGAGLDVASGVARAGGDAALHARLLRGFL